MEVYNGSEYTLLSVPYVHIASFRIMGQRKNVLATARLWAKLKLITHTTTHRQLPSFHPPPPPLQNIACSCATNSQTIFTGAQGRCEQVLQTTGHLAAS